MPSRRQLLRTCGSVALLGAAGCLGTGGDSPNGIETTTSTETISFTAEATTSTTGTTTSAIETTDSPPTTTSAPPEVREVEAASVSERGVPRSPTIESDTYEPFRGFVVGESPEDPGSHYEMPHVWVWNLTGDSAAIEVTVATGDHELRKIEDEFPAGAPLAVAFSDRGTYEVTVRAGDREETVTIEPDRFWCNASGTDVLVRPDGVESETISTMLDCTTTPGGS